MEQPIFFQLSIVMVLAAVLCLVARAFRQPLVIAYIATGFLAGPSVLDIIHDDEAFESFSQMGITLLLFIIGLGLNLSIIKTTGRAVLLSFLARSLAVGSLGFLVGYFFGFTLVESLILAVALLFSSTIIVVKSLSDKKEQSRLYAQLAVGILLIEDIAATLALLFVSTANSGNAGTNGIVLLLAKGILLGTAMAFVGGYLMPKLTKLFAASQELLYIFAIGWAFGVASLFYYAGFSIEVGALFAGLTLAHLPYVQSIATRLKPLRDFFIVLFFVGLGGSLVLSNLDSTILPALVLSAVVLITKPLLTMVSLGLLGYTKQTSFKAGVHLSQISEFSIVLIVLAVNKEIVSNELITIAALTALITIAVSAYLMKYDDRLYRRFSKQLSFFERSDTKRELRDLSHYPLVLLGYKTGGHGFVQTFRQMKKRYVVIDYNPDIIEIMENQHINHIYGDATDLELLDEIGVKRSELVVSTINDVNTNKMLAEQIAKSNEDAIFICHAANLDDAGELYEAGASYVIVAHTIGNEHLNNFIKRNGSNKRAFNLYRNKHLLSLGNLVSRG
jgi:Kef-type K+ transport system membrane component KefB